MTTFKKDFSGIVEAVITECDIYSPEGNVFHTDHALWDTGADTTVISSRVVKGLHLKPYFSIPYALRRGSGTVIMKKQPADRRVV